MSRDFRVVYPPSGENLFDGGKNNKFERSIIEDNESPDCANVVFDAGSVGTRNGFAKVNTASVGSFVNDGLYTRRGTGNAETMVAFFGGTGYTLNATSLVTIGSAQSIYTAGQRMGSAQMENHAFFGNGAITPYKYNGTAFTRHGIPAPSNVISINSNGAGNPNGDYTYKVTFLNSALAEGNPSSASATFTVASKKILITSIPVAPQSHGVSARRLYRTIGTSGTVWYRVATISDNTTTSYDDNIGDASLGTTPPSDNGEPPNYSTIIYHAGRLFCDDPANPGFVWYSNLEDPFTWGALNFRAVGDQSTDFVKGFGVQDNSIVVFCERNVWIIYMPSTDPSGWITIKAKSSYTSKSPFGIFNYNDKVGFPAMQNDKLVGIAALVGDTVEPTSTNLERATVGSELKSDRIEPDVFDFQESYVRNISSIVFKNKAYLSVTKGTAQTQNNRVYVMDFSIDNLSKNQKEAWVPWTGISASQFTIYNGELYYATSTATGFIYKENSGVYSDDGTAINSYFWTKEFSGQKGEGSLSKDFRHTNLLVDLAGAYFMNVAIRTDSDSGDGTNYPVDINPNGSLWGTMVWGVDTWGAGSYQKDVKLPLSGARGKRIQFKFSNQNTAGQRFKVHWQNFTYNLKGPR
jgi:hypothetical protein